MPLSFEQLCKIADIPTDQLDVPNPIFDDATYEKIAQLALRFQITANAIMDNCCEAELRDERLKEVRDRTPEDEKRANMARLAHKVGPTIEMLERCVTTLARSPLSRNNNGAQGMYEVCKAAFTEVSQRQETGACNIEQTKRLVPESVAEQISIKFRGKLDHTGCLILSFLALFSDWSDLCTA